MAKHRLITDVTKEEVASFPTRLGLILFLALVVFVAMAVSVIVYDKTIDSKRMGSPPSTTIQETGEKDSPQSICIQEGKDWDNGLCIQPQLPSETIGREYDPVTHGS